MLPTQRPVHHLFVPHHLLNDQSNVSLMITRVIRDCYLENFDPVQLNCQVDWSVLVTIQDGRAGSRFQETGKGEDGVVFDCVMKSRIALVILNIQIWDIDSKLDLRSQNNS